MNVLCIYPPFPKTYWGAEYTLRLTGRKALLPPLGLLTVAALLPPSFEVRLADLNCRPLEPGEIDRADVVFLSGMVIQKDGLIRAAREARARGKRVVIGGTYASTNPDAVAAHADCVVVGEAEELVGPLVAALADGRPLPRRMQAAERPELSGSMPPPRYDLLDVSAYQSLGVQWSRGCPFLCEFCDIIEIFGRRPRAKSPEQFCRELDAIHATGYRGPVFVVDDNFIAHRREARAMLPVLARWMDAHGHPFGLYTEASVDLADDDGLIAAMVEAGFSTVFLGIETPSPEALRASRKNQNVGIDVDAGVRRLVGSGLEVMAGFIVGFDTDEAESIDRLREWIARSPIPMAMVGLLIALAGTQLERRLAAEGRLLHESDGNSFERPNFVTRLDEATLLEGYIRLLEEIYAPSAYFDRCARALELRPDHRARFRFPVRFALPALARSLVRQGVLSDYRRDYWAFLGRVASTSPRRLPRAFALAINGEHLIRYTATDVVPRLRAALEASPRRDGSRGAHPSPALP